MAGVGNTQQNFRKALGALKDSTKVGLAKVNSDYKELDVAIVKATNHVEQLAKEKHIRTIFEAVSAVRPRADVAYCMHALARRLAKTHNWAVALKTLIVIHRSLKEVDPTFREELINYSRSRGHILNLSHFKDDSSPSAWDYSSWVRTYALYLEERLECFRILKYDVETERLSTRELETVELLEQLPAMQQLLFRLLACQPEGAAMYNHVIQYALSLVAGESIKLYNAINEGTLNLVDKRHDAIRALEIYRKAGHQTERLAEFYEVCKGLDLGRTHRFPKIEQPPSSFTIAMEEYVKEAPLALVVRKDMDGSFKGTAAPKVALEAPKVVKELEYRKTVDAEEKPEPHPPPLEPVIAEPLTVEASPPLVDLLGTSETSKEASELDERNALALAIVPSESSSNSQAAPDLSSGATGWELALVSAPSSYESAATEKLAGGLDKLTLDSLYDDAMTRRASQNGNYHFGQVSPNPFGKGSGMIDIVSITLNVTLPPTLYFRIELI
ncbi:putative clathrin assembly protein [Nymphaea thermarum]|nr:putative clathrin assembly protein [Nymphaea thermarum]